MAQSQYFRWQSPRREPQGDQGGQGGLAAGIAAGKLVASLAGGFQDMQKNMVANKLMNTEDAPRAALVDPGSQTVDVPGSTQDVGGSPGFQDPDPDPIPAQPSLGINTDTDPYSFDLSNDVAATRARNQLVTPPSTMRVPNVIPEGVSTAGTRPHTGGVDEMALQKEMLAMRLQKSQEARATAEEADKEAERQGTGRFALDAAKKRLELAKLQSEIEKANRPEKPDKNAPPENIDSEPTRDLEQLGNYVDKQYGNGVYSGLVNAASTSSTGDELAVAPAAPIDPNAPVEKNPDGSIKVPPAPSIYQSNPDGTPKYNADGTRAIVSGVTVPVQVSKDKVVNMPLAEAQTYIRQTNLHRLKQGLPPFRVPGEEQDVGTTPNKPFIAHNKLEAQSRAPGTYVKLPDGRVVLWQGLKRTK